MLAAYKTHPDIIQCSQRFQSQLQQICLHSIMRCTVDSYTSQYFSLQVHMPIIVSPYNPPCQPSLLEETEVPRGNPLLWRKPITMEKTHYYRGNL